MRRTVKTIAFLVIALLLAPWINAEEKKHVNIVFVGNSITQGVIIDNPKHNAPPVKAAEYIMNQPDFGTVKYSNQGVSGSTTVDHLPETGRLFLKVQEAADLFKDETWATLLFSVMLGTNDSAITGPNGSPVSPEQYEKNMRTIIDRLLALYPNCKIVLHRPIWYSPNTYNGAMYLKAGLNRLNSYLPVIEALVADYGKRFPGQLFLGDTEAYEYFHTNYQTDLIAEDGNAGTFYLHPNIKGAAVLGEYWAKAILKVLNK